MMDPHDSSKSREIVTQPKPDLHPGRRKSPELLIDSPKACLHMHAYKFVNPYRKTSLIDGWKVHHNRSTEEKIS